MSDENDNSAYQPPAQELPPGTRKTGNVEHLLIEAELHDDGECGANPARPINSEVAKEAIETIEREGLQPAWRDSNGSDPQ